MSWNLISYLWLLHIQLIFCASAHSEIFLTCFFFRKACLHGRTKENAFYWNNSKENSEHAPAFFAFWNFLQNVFYFALPNIRGTQRERQRNTNCKERVPCWVTSVRYCRIRGFRPFALHLQYLGGNIAWQVHAKCMWGGGYSFI